MNFFSLLNTCHVLFPLLRPHARVVNLSSSEGHLKKIPGELLRKKFASSSLTEEELTDLMKQFVTLVVFIFQCKNCELCLDFIGLSTRNPFRAVSDPVATYPLAR
jgi:hypothetical protein